MHSIRQAAIAASSLAIRPVVRPQAVRARAVHSSLRTTSWKTQPTSSFLSAFRTYATEPEEAASNVAESATNAASQAKESLKGTAEATRAFAGEAASEASQTAESTSHTARETASSAQDTVPDFAQDAAASIPSRSPASSSQSTPIRAEGIKEKAEPSNNLYIGNLYFEVSQNALREEFSRFGEVKNAKIVYDGRGLSKGFGYIEMANKEQASAAMEALDQQIFEGRRMAVQFAIASGPRSAPKSTDGFRHSPSKTLYIGNMSYEMSDKDLNDLFRQIKNVTDVRVAIDRRTGQPRGYAHADFLDVDSATKAADYLKSKEFYGRTLRVDYTHSKSTDRTPLRSGS